MPSNKNRYTSLGLKGSDPFNLHDRNFDHSQWVADSWTGNSNYLPTGPFGQIYKLLGTIPFSAAGAFQ